MSDVAEAGFVEPRPKALKVGFNVRMTKKGVTRRKGVYNPQSDRDKFKGELRLGKLGKLWLGREELPEGIMIKYDTARKCLGLETIHFDHADYFRCFEYKGVLCNDKSKMNRFLQQAATCKEKRAALRKFVKGECDRIMRLPVIKNFLSRTKSAPRREEGSPVQAGTAHSCSSQPPSMACVETPIQSPPAKSLPPLDRNDAVLGSLDGQRVHKKELLPMPGIGSENCSLSPQIDLCCNDWDAMPMECEDRSGVYVSSPSHVELFNALFSMSPDTFADS